MEATNPIYQRIALALDRIRPYLQADGGDVSLVEITDDNTVKIKLLGSCIDCPMSYQTLKAGIESSLKTAVPEVNQVVSV